MGKKCGGGEYRLCVGGCCFEGSVKMAANNIIYGQPLVFLALD